MLPEAVVELDHVTVLLHGPGYKHLAGHSEDGAVMVPLGPHSCHAGVHQGGVVVILVLHDLHPAVVVADDQGRLLLVRQPILAVIPHEADHLGHGAAVSQTLDVQLGHETSLAIVDMDLARGE